MYMYMYMFIVFGTVRCVLFAEVSRSYGALIRAHGSMAFSYMMRIRETPERQCNNKTVQDPKAVTFEENELPAWGWI